MKLTALQYAAPGQITCQGDRCLRTLPVNSARAYLRLMDKKTDAKSEWVRRRLKQRRHVNFAAVALAAKHGRIAWAILAHGAGYRSAELTAVAA